MNREQAQTKDYTLHLSERAFTQLEDIARKSNKTPEDVLMYGLGLAKIAVEEIELGNKMIIVTSGGTVMREIKHPREVGR